MDVYILTFCRSTEAFYGTELIFKTLRVGFPNAKVTVVDNASLPEVRGEIERQAKENGCEFRQIDNPGIAHHEFIEDTIRACAKSAAGSQPLIFLDPDICMWESCEDFEFDGLIAGRVFGEFYDKVTKTITLPRIHTSFYWVTNPRKLFSEIYKQKAIHLDFQPFLPYSFFLDGKWYRYDTGAGLFSILSGKVSFFTEEHFNRYDHLYAGSHLNCFHTFPSEETKAFIMQTHENAKMGNIQSLKGIWRGQVKAFANIR